MKISQKIKKQKAKKQTTNKKHYLQMNKNKLITDLPKKTTKTKRKKTASLKFFKKQSHSSHLESYTW